MNKPGFTLIELLIGITVLSILSLGTYNNFQSIQSRSVFQTQTSRIYNNLIQIKNSAFNERISLINIESEEDDTALEPSGQDSKNNTKYVAEFEFSEQKQISDAALTGKKILSNIKFYYTTEVENSETGLLETEITNLIELPNIISNNLNLIIDEFWYLDNNAEPVFKNIKNESFKITFDADKKLCDFSSTTLVEELENINMIKIPLKIRSNVDDIRTIRYLYLHKKSCLPEILIQEINA